MSSLTLQSVRQGYWVSSLLSYGFQGNAGFTKTLRLKAHAAIPQLSDPLTGSLSSRLHCTKAQHAYLRDRHLVSYADVIAWTGTGWRWQFSDLPLPLLDALRGLSLPVSESVPLLPGQAWHLTDPSQLFSNRITEILTVSTYSTPNGLRSDIIVYRHWTLPVTSLSPFSLLPCGQSPVVPPPFSSITVLVTSTHGFRKSSVPPRCPASAPLG